MESFVDRLLTFIDRDCGQKGFRTRCRGVSEKDLADFEERPFQGPVPAEFREYLKSMGSASPGFRLCDDDDEGFDGVREYYAGASDSPDGFFPRGDSIIISLGYEYEYFLDGRRRGSRPVWFHSRQPALFPVADSLEAHCFQRAWRTFRFLGLGSEAGSAFGAESPGAVDRAVAAAIREGLRLEPFSDSVNRLFLGDSIGLDLYRDHAGEWQVRTRGQDQALGKRLAEAIAHAAGAPARP